MKSSLNYRPKTFGKKPSAVKIVLQIEEVHALLSALEEYELSDIEDTLERHLQRQANIFHEKSNETIEEFVNGARVIS